MDGLRIVVAAHKPYPMPEDPVYLPVQAGAAIAKEKLDYQSDADGENISAKNGFYCELTALYWAWKNLPHSALGLAHYRRYFRARHGKRPMPESELRALLEKTPVLLPKKRHYWIETNESQYVHAHGQASLDALKKAVGEVSPEYLPALEKSLKKRSAHRFNMFVMRKDEADRYCEWMFGILFALERELNESYPQVIFPRIYGFLSERLMDCWVETNRLPYREIRVLNTESQHWGKKIRNFLMRKFRGSDGGK